MRSVAKAGPSRPNLTVKQRLIRLPPPPSKLTASPTHASRPLSPSPHCNPTGTRRTVRSHPPARSPTRRPEDCKLLVVQELKETRWNDQGCRSTNGAACRLVGVALEAERSWYMSNDRSDKGSFISVHEGREASTRQGRRPRGVKTRL